MIARKLTIYLIPHSNDFLLQRGKYIIIQEEDFIVTNYLSLELFIAYGRRTVKHNFRKLVT